MTKSSTRGRIQESSTPDRIFVKNVNQCQCNPSAFVRKKSTVTTVTPNISNTPCCCNAASSATQTKGPWLGIDYAEGVRKNNPIPALANKPCFVNGKFLFKNAATAPAAGGSCNQFNPCAEDPGDSDPMCYGDSAWCNRGPGADPCGEQTLGKVQPFVGSMVQSMAMAGTPASNNNVMVRATDECGVVCCADNGKEVDGELRRFCRTTCTWQLYTPQFSSEIESNSISGDGHCDPYGLDLEFIAANLAEIYAGNEDLLDSNGIVINE